MMDLSDLSHSYPFLHLSRKLGVPYEVVLRVAEMVDHPDPAYPGVIAATLVSGLTLDGARLIERVCHAPWRWQFPPQGRGL